jgi:hypothetical protein
MGITPIDRVTTPVPEAAAPIRIEPVTSHNSTSGLAFSLQLFIDGFEYPLMSGGCGAASGNNGVYFFE